jgi:hypothetical protein
LIDPVDPQGAGNNKNRADADALRAVLDRARDHPERVQAVDVAAEKATHERVELDRLRQFIKLRGNWSLWLTIWISGLLVFHVGLAIAIGRSWLDFKDYPSFLPMVVLQNFAQIAGMGLIIVKFLYPTTGGTREPRG